MEFKILDKRLAMLAKEKAARYANIDNMTSEEVMDMIIEEDKELLKRLANLPPRAQS